MGSRYCEKPDRSENDGLPVRVGGSSSSEPEWYRRDAELLARARGGDSSAYAELWRHHHAAAIRVAKRYSRSLDAEDVAAEAFARVFAAMDAGAGPKVFRPYLMVTVRNVISRWSRQESRIPTVSIDAIEDSPMEQGADVIDRMSAADAFRSLPPRWQLALWYSEVQGFGASEIGELLRITPSAAAMLTYRARRGLRKAWGSDDKPELAG
ncbi:RNA polymerase sigma factor [Leifsonia sp. NPDC058230]|uniref:RNA polymerase sigma factor n=1 Tax=Leifsonia sp. NPDC058230 TaxID=3346391 RepID=UPI0036D9F40C